VRVLRTVALPFNGHKPPVDRGNNFPPSGEQNLERFAALPASVILPGEGKPWNGQGSFRAKGCRLLSLLKQEFANRYGALFLSRSYFSKIASTSSREIDTPAL
jgi:hypothetical protein